MRVRLVGAVPDIHGSIGFDLLQFIVDHSCGYEHISQGYALVCDATGDPSQYDIAWTPACTRPISSSKTRASR